MKRKLFVVTALVLIAASVFASGGQDTKATSAGKKVRIAILVKSLGNGFFEAVRDGAQEAAKELGDVEIIYQGPSSATAEGQIEIINNLIATKVDAIAISANDQDALVPAAKKAMEAGIKVISFDSGIAEAGRILHLAPSDTELIGRSQMRLMGELVNWEGEVAILSATAQATNQNAWIEYMKKEIQENPKCKNMKLVAVVYGDDSSDKSYREALGLFKSYPNLKGIISPTTVGVAATAKAIQDQGLTGKIQLTGLGLPSEMKAYVENGVSKAIALWNPIDLGYSSTYICYNLVKGKNTGKEGDTFTAGRMGTIKVGPKGLAIMGEPFTFTKDNIAKYAAMF
ncbi:rhamnose ABC transporter substrate-binding protein [Gracilinema caldarium]|uniref:rhamnose ABC transporter substrate-binding protein n=1 Tax=Gracilinema caldarium TaxID=215591 RepID=UPI0026EDC0A7|nr:rhamnose ABC transporter substrate-binding protein [Gracilinema caldarium]